MISLSKYITSWLFLKDNKINFERIIFEQKNDCPNCVSLFDIWLDFNSNWIIQNYLNTDNCLLILDKLNLHYFFEILSEIDENLTLINCNVWLSSYYSKNSEEIEDIILAQELWFHIYEPFDIESLINIFKIKQEKKYIRIVDKDYPKSLLDPDFFKPKECKICNNNPKNNWQNQARQQSIIDLTSKENELVDITLLSTWSTLPQTVMSAKNLLEKNQIKSDIFLLYNFDFQNIESFHKHCKNTGKLFIIIDHKNDLELQEIFSSNLNIKSLEIHLITPNFDKISTNLEFYIYEQAEFEHEQITNRILSYL